MVKCQVRTMASCTFSQDHNAPGPPTSPPSGELINFLDPLDPTSSSTLSGTEKGECIPLFERVVRPQPFIHRRTLNDELSQTRIRHPTSLGIKRSKHFTLGGPAEPPVRSDAAHERRRTISGISQIPMNA